MKEIFYSLNSLKSRFPLISTSAFLNCSIHHPASPCPFLFSAVPKRINPSSYSVCFFFNGSDGEKGERLKPQIAKKAIEFFYLYHPLKIEENTRGS